MINLPETFLLKMKDLLGAEEFAAFVESYSRAPVRGVRYNQLKVKTEGALPQAARASSERSERPALQPHELFEKSSTKTSPETVHSHGFNERVKGLVPCGGGGGETPTVFSLTENVTWCAAGFYYNEDERPAKTLGYQAGLFYIQEPSAMCPGEEIGVRAGDYVLDLCAAPGGKSVQIAGHMRGEGLLVSNDASATRCRALVKNLERAGVTNAVVITEQPKKLAERFAGFFDRILVDAPCSGEGMFRRDADVLKAYSANKPDACAAVQREILKYASVMLKAGGRLVYSTCTFNDMENEGTVAAFLEKHEDFVLVKMRRIWPHKEKGEGHFVAVLEKAGEGGERTHSESTIKPPREFAEFCRGMLEYDFGEGAFVMHGKNLYFQRVPLDLRGIRVARSGWFLGECAKGRFVPSHALAMGLKKEQARFSVELSEQDAWRYLKGETLEFQGNSAFDDLVESDKPYVLMCYKSYPLGWARLVQGRLKNNLPVGWAVK